MDINIDGNGNIVRDTNYITNNIDNCNNKMNNILNSISNLDNTNHNLLLEKLKAAHFNISNFNEILTQFQAIVNEVVN